MLRLIVVASLLVGCRVSLEDDDPPAGNCVIGTSQACLDAVGKSDLAWIQTNIFTPSCNFSGCHGSSPDSAVVLLAGQSHTSLVNASSLVASGRKVVVANDVNASLLMLMLGYVAPANATPATTGIPGPGRMPLGGEALCCQKLEAIERWIEAGAPNN